MTRSIRLAYISAAVKRTSWRLRGVGVGVIAAGIVTAVVLSSGGGGLAATTASACKTANLTLARSGFSYGTFQYLEIYSLTNTGQSPCTLEGYPQVALQTASGSAVKSAQVTYTTDAPVYGVSAASQVTLQPGDAAGLYVGSIGDPGASRPCDPAARQMGTMDVTPPSDTAPLSVPVPVNTSCPSAPLYVSPILPSPAGPATTTSG